VSIQAEDGIRDFHVTGVQTCALPIYDCQQGEDTELQSLARGLYVKKDSSLRDRLGAKFVPFAAVTDSQGIVVSKGLVNGISHVRSEERRVGKERSLRGLNSDEIPK